MPLEMLTEDRSKLLDINGRTPIFDELARKALAAVQEAYLRPDHDGARTTNWRRWFAVENPARADRSSERGSDSRAAYDHATTTDVVLSYIHTKGIGADVLKLTKLLNKTSIDESSRALLATPGVYETLLLQLFEHDHAEPKDVEGLVPAIVVAVQDRPRHDLYAQLLDAFRQEEGLLIEDATPLYARFLEQLIRRGVPLGIGKTSSAMRAIFEDVRAEGDLRSYVDKYANKGEIDRARFTPEVRQAIVDYLESIGIRQITEQKFADGKYDEYFAQGYHQALFARNGGIAPLQNVLVPPAATEFRLPTYEYLDEQGVVPASIHTAAALYQIFMIGDKLGMLEMPNALLARRARGKLDLPSGTASTLLQKYKRFQRAEDVQPEERMLLYKRVFNLGGGKVLEDTAINEAFPPLWDSLMREVTNFITKDEMSNAVDERISRSAIQEAIRNIQVNLSFHAADIDEDVRLMMEQYNLAESILRSREIMAAIGLVRRQTLQAAIEALVANDMASVPLVKAMFTLGTKGQEILHFVADYDESTPEEDYQRFLRLAEAWIIARASLKDTDLSGSDEPAQDDGDIEEDPAEDDDWES